MSLARHDAVLIAAVTVGWLVTPGARTGWSFVAVPEHFSTAFAWLDYASLSLWLFEFFWAALFGVFLAHYLPSQRALLWSLLFGIWLGLSHFIRSTYYFGPGALLSTYIWAYGQYFVPTFGAVVACRLVQSRGPRHKLGSHAA